MIGTVIAKIFGTQTERDIKRINDDIGMVLEPTASYRVDEPYYEAWNRRFYQYPEWWEGMPVVPEMLDRRPASGR